MSLIIYAFAINTQLHKVLGIQRAPQLRIAEPMIAALITYGILAGITWAYHRQWRSLAFGKGVLIGLGIGLTLALSVCAGYLR
jgi:hypothetical protein